ncbi:MAG: PhzF family phenazine biosynthesis isomerase, partial [Natronospirillum sp.]
MPHFRFSQVNVFSADPFAGNPLAVVHDADPLDGDQMLAMARWTNLSETAFLLTPTAPEADYQVRIFSPQGELPFAGHPTLGSCHAWLAAGGAPHHTDHIVQQSGEGQVKVRRKQARLDL